MIKNIFERLNTFLFPVFCIKCNSEGFSICENCLLTFQRAVDTPFPFITSLYSYKDPFVRETIHKIKYYKRRDLLLPFAKKMAQELHKDNISGMLVPIPMPTLRIYYRGFNQAELLTFLISKELGFPYSNKLLSRKKYTARQTHMNRKERLLSMRNVFAVNEAVPETVILIDDVTTTGATLLEARNILLHNGVKNVYAYTIAH